MNAVKGDKLDDDSEYWKYMIIVIIHNIIISKILLLYLNYLVTLR